MNGIFSLNLHAHMPYCRKNGRWPAGEEWLFEAMYETYIPLLIELRKFQKKNLKPRIMIDIVPILAEQLADPYMIDQFLAYLEDKKFRAQKDCIRFNTDIKRKTVAEYWLHYFEEIDSAFKKDFYCNILNSFKWLMEENIIEILTSAATHGLLPLFEHDSTIFSQIHLGVTTYIKYFGKKPKGIWLPECAYRPREYSKKFDYERRSIDEWLADEGIKYFFIEDKGIMNAEFVENKHNETHPTTYRGYKLESGVCVFGRNTQTGKRVWSSEIGYPGNEWYREFFQKDNETGLHYWRITRKNQKEIYEPIKASEVISSQARDFFSLLTSEFSKWHTNIPEAIPLIISPYDCELYGHWWHEGIQWISNVYELMLHQSDIVPLTLNEVIEKWSDTYSTIRMKPSSWGENGDFTVWTNPEHAWIWPYINETALEFETTIQNIMKRPILLDSRQQRIIKQSAREFLLMVGSDWPFLLHTQQARQYANDRFHHHHQRFLKLISAVRNIDQPHLISDFDLTTFEDIDNPWFDIDYTMFQRIPH